MGFLIARRKTLMTEDGSEGVEKKKKKKRRRMGRLDSIKKGILKIEEEATTNEEEARTRKRVRWTMIEGMRNFDFETMGAKKVELKKKRAEKRRKMIERRLRLKRQVPIEAEEEECEMILDDGEDVTKGQTSSLVEEVKGD